MKKSPIIEDLIRYSKNYKRKKQELDPREPWAKMTPQQIYEKFHKPVSEQTNKKPLKVLLMDQCKDCDIKNKCDTTPLHPYDNPIYHNCKHKKDIASQYGWTRNDKPKAMCTDCKKYMDEKKGRWINLEFVCFICYPKEKEYNYKKDTSANLKTIRGDYI